MATGTWLSDFEDRIGCGECRGHWRQWVRDHPPDVSHHGALFAWTVAAHNAVNRRLGRPEMDLTAAEARWSADVGGVVAPPPSVELVMENAGQPGRGGNTGLAVNCRHAGPGPRHLTATCALGLYGGRPHVAVCGDCHRRQPVDPDAPAVSPPAPRGGAPAVPFQPAGTPPAARPVPALARADRTERLLLRSRLSPGDTLMLTAAVRDLHRAHPGRYATAVDTTAPELWDHNPYVTRADAADGGWRAVDMHYPLIDQSNQRPVHFLRGYADYLASVLGVPVPVTEFRGDVHLGADERAWTNQVRETTGYGGPFWVLMAGGKYDFTAKWWPPAYYQRVVDHFAGRVQFVQCGQTGHWHPPLQGVFNLVGRTTVRQFVRLVYHAQGVVCPVTFAMHLAAAVPTKDPRLRPCVVIAGGREPPHWEAYPGHQFLHTVGCLPCCATGGCWRSRCQPVGDGDPRDRENLCDRPVQVAPNLRIPQCMVMVQPADVIRAIERSLVHST